MHADIEDIKSSFAELMIANPDILEIDLHGNILRVLVKDEANVDGLPATFLHESGLHVGIEYMTPGRQKAMEEHRQIEAEAIAADPTPGKPVQLKVREYLESRLTS